MAKRGKPARAGRAAADGRVRRGERNRAAIVAALFELVGEGVLEPTAEQVATRAGVGLRSVFRHFRDMDGLYAAIDVRLRAEIEPVVYGDRPRGTLAERARAMAARRAWVFERIAPYKRSAGVSRRRSRFLDAQHRALVGELRRHLRRWLPELGRAPRPVADAIELVTSFEAWDRMRDDQGLSAARAQAALEAAVAGLLRVRRR